MRGTELVVTAKQDGERTQIGAYGSKTTAIVSGILGHLFNISLPKYRQDSAVYNVNAI